MATTEKQLFWWILFRENYLKALNSVETYSALSTRHALKYETFFNLTGYGAYFPA